MKSCYRYIGYLRTNPDVEFWHCTESVTPWRISRGGGGHYFTSVEALAGYCSGRSWIHSFQVDSLAAQLKANADSILIFEPRLTYRCINWR